LGRVYIMVLKKKTLFRFLGSAALILLLGWLIFGSPFLVHADALLTTEPITWNVVGLDSNNVNVGPNNFPVGVRVCNTGDDPATNVSADFIWDSSDPYISLRTGSLDPITTSSIAASDCFDFYFEVEISRDANAYDHTREYHIEVSSTETSTISTPTPREIYVEHLISQSRNSTTDVLLDTVSIAPGGTMTLMLGETYDIELVGSTATNGYEQIESYINFPNTIFQINSVTSTYTANGGTDPDAATKVYADGCSWENDSNSPNYRSCLSTGKYGGDITVTYNVTIIGGAGTSETLNTLIYDFSGSSYHYNSDFSVAGRIAAIVDPSLVTIDKNFAPDPTSVTGTSTLTFTLSNPNDVAISGASFTDTFQTSPGAMTVASPATYSTNSCGIPTFAPTAGAGSISFSDGTIPANGSCTVSVQVSTTAIGTYNNVSNNLFIDTTDTGNSASDSLVVNDDPSPPPCTPGLELATWTFPGLSTTYTFKSNLVSSATENYTGTGTPSIDTAIGNPVNSWKTTGGWASNNTGFPNPAAPYFEFVLGTSNFTGVSIDFDYHLSGNWASPNSNNLYLYSNADGGAFSQIGPIPNPISRNTWYLYPTTAAASTGSSTTAFRINAVSQQQPTAALHLDNVIVTGCGVPQPPAITKAFSPDPIAVNGISTLTFTITNENNVSLTGLTFTDALPSGVEVAATPAASTTCGGSPTWAPASGGANLEFGNPAGGTVPGRVGTTNGSCTVQVDVTATTSGPHSNVSGFISSTETGKNTGPDGSATDTLTAISPPSISKQFAPNPILVNGTSTLTFTITNPNPDDQLTNVAFSDTYPTNVVNAAAPATSSTCGGVVTAAAGLDTLAFSGGTIAGGGTCTVQVDVTSAVDASYANTSGNVSADLVGNGSTASDTLVVEPIRPSISLLKQVSSTGAAPWTTFIGVNVGDSVWYQFTVENTGDVALTGVNVTDPTLTGLGVDLSSCSWANLALYETQTCLVGPVIAVSGSNSNTATAHGTYNLTDNTDISTATYATTGLTLVKTAAESTFTAAGDVLHYSYLVTNSGFAPLAGPVTIDDDKAIDESCPDVDTVGDFDAFLDPADHPNPGDPAESLTCTATYTITGSDVSAGSVTNTATASANGVYSNDDSETVNVAIPAINVIKEVGASATGPWDDTSITVTVGGDVYYRITVENTGNVSLTGITVSDPDVDTSGCTWTDPLAVSATTSCVAGPVTALAGTNNNTATADSSETGPDTDGAQYLGLVLPTISKSFSPATIAEGGTSLLTITLSNSNTVALTGASLTDTYPSGVVNAAVPNPATTCAGGTASTPSADSVAISGGTIPASGSCTVTVTVTAADPGSYLNTIAAGDLSTTQGLTNASPASATLTVTDVLPDISVSKTANPVSVPETGGSVTFTFVVTNNAAEDAALTALDDSDFGDLDTQGTCAVPQTIAASGGTYTCAITQTISGDFGGPDHSNTVTATAEDDDGNTDTATDSATVTFSDVLPDISVSKTANPVSVPETGGSVTFTIVVTNNAAEDATLTALDDSDFGDLDTQGTCAVPQTIAASGGTYTCAITQPISGDFGGPDHSNTVTATATDDDGNTDTATDTATVTFTDVLPDISVSKTANPVSVPETGGSVTFTIVVTNNAAEQATLTSLSADQFGDLDGQGSCTVTQTLAASGGTYTCSFTGLVPAGDASGAGHTDMVTAVAADDDGNTDTATDSATVTYTDVAPTTVVTKTANPTNVTAPGGLVTFSVDVQNTSGEAVTLTSLVDDIHLDLNGQGTCATGGSIASGATYSCTFTATVSGSAGDSETDTVTAVVMDNEGSTGTDNDSATVTVTAPIVIDPGVTKSGDPLTAQVGDTVTFTLFVFNIGNADADNVIVTDVIPSFLDVIPPVVISPLGPGVTITGNTIVMDFGTVEPSESWTVTITTVVNALGVPPGDSNDVTLVTTSDDADLDNNDDSVFITISGDGPLLPGTGFAPNRVTALPQMPADYAYLSYGELRLEIPKLDVDTSIVGVPRDGDGWDVTWLWDKAGYLGGTAFPTWSGNSVITGHVVLANGLEGPFADLKELEYGDAVIVHGWGEQYIYEIREVDIASPYDPSVLRHEEYPWLTLVTCAGFDEKSDSYRWRVVARAVMVLIDSEVGSWTSSSSLEQHDVQTFDRVGSGGIQQ